MREMRPQDRDCGEAVSSLARKLERCPQVTQFDGPTEKEAWTLAHSLLDLKESFEAILAKQLPKLVDSDLAPEDIHRVLLEIGEELRHVAYHLKDPRFFRYLHEEE